jgi:tetratricopeptide (TPR) repeat protein
MNISIHRSRYIFLFTLLALALLLPACATVQGPGQNRKSTPSSRLDQIAMTKYAQQDYPLALRTFTQALNQNPQDARLYFNRALCHTRLNHNSRALKDYDRALRIDPQLVPAMVNKARLLLELNEPSQAVHLLRQARSIESTDPRIAYNLGQALYEENRLSQAREAFQEAIDLDPYFPEAFNSLGVIKLEMNQVREAIRDFSQAITLQGDNPLYFFNRGVSREALEEDFDQALDDYSRALELNNSYIPALYNRGLMYFNLGRKKEACSDLSRACSLDGPCSRYEYLVQHGECPKPRTLPSE